MMAYSTWRSHSVRTATCPNTTADWAATRSTPATAFSRSLRAFPAPQRRPWRARTRSTVEGDTQTRPRYEPDAPACGVTDRPGPRCRIAPRWRPPRRGAARRSILTRGGLRGRPRSGLPAVGTDAVQLHHRARPGHRPAFLGGLVDQLEQPRFGGRIDACRDRAAQPQLDFPAGPPARRLGRSPPRRGGRPRRKLADSDASATDTLRCPGPTPAAPRWRRLGPPCAAGDRGAIHSRFGRRVGLGDLAGEYPHPQVVLLLCVRNRFALLVADTGLVLHGEGQQPSQMRSEDPRILLHTSDGACEWLMPGGREMGADLRREESARRK